MKKSTKEELTSRPKSSLDKHKNRSSSTHREIPINSSRNLLRRQSKGNKHMRGQHNVTSIIKGLNQL